MCLLKTVTLMPSSFFVVDFRLKAWSIALLTCTKEAVSVRTQLHVPMQVHEGDLKFTFPSSSSAAVSSQAHIKLQQPMSAWNPGSLEWTWEAGLQNLCSYPGMEGERCNVSQLSLHHLRIYIREGIGSQASSACFKSCSWRCCGVGWGPCHQCSAPSIGYVLVLTEEEEKHGRQLHNVAHFTDLRAWFIN